MSDQPGLESVLVTFALIVVVLIILAPTAGIPSPTLTCMTTLPETSSEMVLIAPSALVSITPISPPFTSLALAAVTFWPLYEVKVLHTAGSSGSIASKIRSEEFMAPPSVPTGSFLATRPKARIRRLTIVSPPGILSLQGLKPLIERGQDSRRSGEV